MAEFNIVNSNKYVRCSSFISGPYRINIANSSGNKIQYGDERCMVDLYGKSINLNSSDQINLYSTNDINTYSTLGSINFTAFDNIKIKSNGIISLDGGVKITNTTTVMYGTGDPPSNAEIGQLYFKLIN